MTTVYFGVLHRFYFRFCYEQNFVFMFTMLYIVCTGNNSLTKPDVFDFDLSINLQNL